MAANFFMDAGLNIDYNTMQQDSKNCVLREDCHTILQSLGYRNKEERDAFIENILGSTNLRNSFPSPEFLKIVKEWTNEELNGSKFYYIQIILVKMGSSNN